MKWLDKEQAILNAPVPAKIGRYCPIPHSVLITELEERLNRSDIQIQDKKYLTSSDNKVIFGQYKLKMNNTSDIEMCPAINFTNSYNKLKKFSISGGALVLVCSNGMIASRGKRFSRKHIGDNALNDANFAITSSILNIKEDFNNLILNREEMKEIELSRKVRSQLVGEMILEHSLITSTQLSILNNEVKFSKEFKNKTLWDFYNHTTEAFKENHPLKYEDQMIKFHSYISSQFNLTGNNQIYARTI